MRTRPRCTSRFLACLMLHAGVITVASGTDNLKRYPVPADTIRHGIGHCYVATMDFGEDGDKFTGNKSGLLLYEDGKPLGPARCLHADIRNLGEACNGKCPRSWDRLGRQVPLDRRGFVRYVP